MKRIRIAGIVVSALIVCLAGTVSATSLNFIGPSYRFSDADGDGFSGKLSLDRAPIALATPSNDGVFGDAAWETVVFSDFFLDPLSFVSGERYDFAAKNYANGITMYDDDNTLLFDADVSLSSLEVNGSTGDVNPLFSMNLTNIDIATDYVVGSSEIIDAFRNLSGGAVNFTLQFSAPNFGGMIENGDSFNGTYSGSLAPMATPEPGTVLLIGTGLFGIAAMARKKRK